MTAEENLEHMMVLPLYQIHVILTVQIYNISDNNMLEIKIIAAILIYSLPWQKNEKIHRHLCPVIILVQEYIWCSYFKIEYFLVKNAIEVI